MPFRSEAQRRYLWANHPEIASRWSKEFGSKVAIPPQFLKNKGKPDPRAEAKKKAAAAKLAKLKGKKGAKMVPDTDMDGN